MVVVLDGDGGGDANGGSNNRDGSNNFDGCGGGNFGGCGVDDGDDNNDIRKGYC